jgi:predicted regulator of Ras-like GTPase activity (Roadblock/LC7/MglB family)
MGGFVEISRLFFDARVTLMSQTSTAATVTLTQQHRQLCHAELTRLIKDCPDIKCALLALRDGRPFTQVAQPGLEPARFAAMLSSLSALSESLLRELAAGSLDHVLVDGSDGKLIISKVPGCGGMMILGLLASHGTFLGLLLGHAKESSSAISGVLQRR